MALKLNLDKSDGIYFLTGTTEELIKIYDLLSTKEAYDELKVIPYGKNNHFPNDCNKYAIAFDNIDWTLRMRFSVWRIDGVDAQCFEVIKDYGDEYRVSDVIDTVRNYYKAGL